MKPKKIFAIFISYNAATTLETFYKNFPTELFDRIILVDDCSQDGTYELAKKLGIESYKNETNLGYGGNLKRAINIALEKGADVIVDIHPDGEYLPDAIPDALKKISEGNEFILGNRFAYWHAPIAQGMFIWKLFPLLFLNMIDQIAFQIPVHDFHQGFRVYTKNLFDKISIEHLSDDYLFSYEIIAVSAYKKILFAEVPVSVSYIGTKRGATLKKSISYTLATFKIRVLYLLAVFNIYISKLFT